MAWQPTHSKVPRSMAGSCGKICDVLPFNWDWGAGRAGRPPRGVAWVKCMYFAKAKCEVHLLRI
jgi:hypothetical protein